ncbi:MAG: RES family NAD+ phosphorylase [Eubacteriales bacterium]|nr:RES family NAD+ phosphorylase [Eubacteriales bacterium]
MDDMQGFVDSMDNWGFSINARNAFSRFIKAIEDEKGLTVEVQRIFNIIDDIVLGKEERQFVKELKPGDKYYRARIINPEDDGDLSKGIGKTPEGKFLGYNDTNSREPLLGISGEGRNNISGASYLYVASNPETACMEIKSQFGDLISLATFELTETLKIIDFASEKTFQRSDTKYHGVGLGVLFSQLMLRYTEPVRGENAYKATQTISDYLRKTGIDGIAYKSFLTPGGINYTIFNSHPRKIKFCESKVLLHKQANHSFWDFNEGSELMSNREGRLLVWDDKIAEEHKKHLSERFNMHEK